MPASGSLSQMLTPVDNEIMLIDLLNHDRVKDIYFKQEPEVCWTEMSDSSWRPLCTRRLARGVKDMRRSSPTSC